MSREPRQLCARPCFGLGLVVLLGAVAFAQDKDTVWTKVTAEGSTLTLGWDRNHPWAADLGGRGATLVAKYRLTSRQETLEVLTAPSRSAGKDGRQLRFSLPDALRGDPAGPVCLFFQMPGRRVLPLRRADKHDADTSGFRYEPWERAARQRSSARIAQQRVASAERSLERANKNMRNQEQAASSRGWQSVESCQSVPTPNFTLGERPRQVVPPAEHDGESRRLCVYRALIGNRLRLESAPEALGEDISPLKAARAAEKIRARLSGYFGSAFQGIDTDPVTFIQDLANALGRENATVRARSDEMLAFVDDVGRHGAFPPGYQPRLPNYSNTLGWPSSAGEAVFRLYGKALAHLLDLDWAVEGLDGNSRDRETVLGAVLDAYSGCVEDARKQFARNWTTWTGLRASASARAEMAKDFLVRECRQEMQTLESVRADRDRFQQQLSAEQAALKLASVVPPVAGRAQNLNTSSCAPP